MTPEEYIEKLKEVQRTLDMVKEDLDRAVDKMQRRIETGYEHLERDSRLAALAGREYVNLLNTIKQKVGGSAKYIFVPNKLQSSFGTAAEVSMWKQCASMYGMVGKVMPKVPQRANLKRIDTYDITPSQREILRATFEGIIKELNI